MTQNELTKDDYFTDEEVEKMVTDARSRVNRNYRYSFEKHSSYCMLQMLLKTGLRVSELCSITIPQIERGLREGEFRIVGKGGMSTKDKAKIRKATRVVMISSELNAIIDNYLFQRKQQESTTNKLLISRTGKPLTQQKVHSRMQTICRLAGVTPKKTHATRHTTGMMLYKKTKDILTTSAILGHSSVITTQVYVKATSEDRRKAIELL